MPFLPWSVFVAGFQFSALMIGRHTCPFSSMLGWYTFVINVIFGGLNGYSAGNSILIRNAPLLYGGFSCNKTEISASNPHEVSVISQHTSISAVSIVPIKFGIILREVALNCSDVRNVLKTIQVNLNFDITLYCYCCCKQRLYIVFGRKARIIGCNDNILKHINDYVV